MSLKKVWKKAKWCNFERAGKSTKKGENSHWTYQNHESKSWKIAESKTVTA